MRHEHDIAFARLGAGEEPSWDWRTGPLSSITYTDSETSVVCAYDAVPEDVVRQGPLTAFEIAGPLDFTMVGVLSGLLEPLARQGISILALSTYDTDWILVGGRAARRRRGDLEARRQHRRPGPALGRHVMSVTTPQGFRAAGVAAGLKASGAPDLALVVNDGPDHHAAAVFTSNRVEAAPVTWSRQAVTRRPGRRGRAQLRWGQRVHRRRRASPTPTRTAEKVAEVLGVSAGDVVVCSTGLIGELLPMDRPARRSRRSRRRR